MIGGALALATGMGLAISGWLVRRREALHHREAPGHDLDAAHFVDEASTFVPAGPEVFRPREKAQAVRLPLTDEAAAEAAEPGEQPQRVRVEELEETLRDVMEALRKSAA
jgi:hypothetical protein